jgi:transglutaminase-like putative cysteine protease
MKNQRWWDLVSVVCLLAALWVAAVRLQLTDWTTHLEITETLVILGALLGVALGQSRFNRWFVLAMGAFYSITAVSWQLGLTMDSGIEWSERLASLTGRLGIAFRQFLSNHPVDDPILFLATMALMFWVFSLWAGYNLTRKGKPWIPLTVIGIAIFSFEYFNPSLKSSSFYSAFFAFFYLLLLGRVRYLKDREIWQTHNALIENETGFDYGRGVAVAGFILILVSWNMPALVDLFSPNSPSHQKLLQAWQRVQDSLANMVVTLKSPSGLPNDYYAPEMLLGTGAVQGDDFLFTVKVSQPPTVRYYWRSRSFDTYQGGVWSTNGSTDLPIAAKETLNPYPNWEGRTKVDFTFNLAMSSLRVLMAPSVPLISSRPIEEVALPTGVNGASDPVALIVSTPLHSGETYQVTSLVDTPNQKLLRSSSGDYPAWISQRYLQLPDNLTSRVRQLAVELTQNQATVFDRVQAVTNYLRTHIEYQNFVPAHPADQETIDWLLFTYQKGFCNYYASAEVILLRAAGIPARLAVGFAQGEYDSKNKDYIVRRRDSHAWPEVYFNNLGWVEFEPTASQAALDLPLNEPVNAQTGQANNPDNGGYSRRFLSREDSMTEDLRSTRSSQTPGGNSGWLAVLLIFGGSGLIVFGLWRFSPLVLKNRSFPTFIVDGLNRRGINSPRWLRVWARRSALSPIERVYLTIPDALFWLGVKAKSGQTPAEQAALLTERIPAGSDSVAVILKEYQRAVYSPYPIEFQAALQARKQIWEKVVRTLLHRFFVAEEKRNSKRSKNLWKY